jgi:hypothetical protein
MVKKNNRRPAFSRVVACYDVVTLAVFFFNRDNPLFTDNLDRFFSRHIRPPTVSSFPGLALPLTSTIIAQHLIIVNTINQDF